MNDRELISALMDGELEGPDHDRALDLLACQPALAETWRRWQLVRSSLRHEASDTVDLSARVAERLADEPVIQQARLSRIEGSQAGKIGFAEDGHRGSFALSAAGSAKWYSVGYRAPSRAAAVSIRVTAGRFPC